MRSSSTTIDCTSAGASALITNCAGLSSHGMMSTRSPAISLDTACTREPRMPTQVPTGSMRGSLVLTAILARMPGSRAAALISIRPSPISGTSSSNSSIRNSGAVRERNNCGPRGSARTSLQECFDAILGLELFARDHVCARHEAFRVAPEIHIDAVAVDALDHAADQGAHTVLVLLDDLRALGLAHLLYDDLFGLLRSNAPEGGRFHRLFHIQAGSCRRVDIRAVLEPQLGLRVFDFARVVGEHLPAAERLIVAGLAVDGTRTSHSSLFLRRAAAASAASSASKMISLSTPFSLETASTTRRISLFIAFYP